MTHPSRVAIVGGGIAGLAAAYELTKQNIAFQVFEAGPRLGGIVETERRDGFIMECGPDGWVSEKPWARELAIELGLEHELIASNDADRVTWIARAGALHAIPNGMRMMVPTDFDALRGSDLFSKEAIAAYEAELRRAEELRQYAQKHAGEDESVARFTRRHFGEEVVRTIAAPLLAGVFGGDIERLSAQSVMPQFVAMEREHGSLITALRAREKRSPAQPIFTTLRGGVGTLVEKIAASLPEFSVRLDSPVGAIKREDDAWKLQVAEEWYAFDHLLLATPAHVTRTLLASLDAEAAALLEMDASSAVLVAMAFTAEQARGFDVPAGFGALVPPGTEGTDLLAATFVDQKFAHRVPQGARLLRAFFGSSAAERLQQEDDTFLSGVALAQMSDLLGQSLPLPWQSVVRRWPRSLPQYAVGHGDRMRRLEERIARHSGLALLGNAYRGVGLPDLIRDGRAVVRAILD